MLPIQHFFGRAAERRPLFQRGGRRRRLGNTGVYARERMVSPFLIFNGMILRDEKGSTAQL